MKPKQLENLKCDPDYIRFVQEGAKLKVSKLISMSYLVASVFDAYQEEAQEIMDKYHMTVKGIKTKANNLTQSFDAYDKEMRTFLNEEEARKLITEDYENLKSLCDRFMNYEEEKPQK